MSGRAKALMMLKIGPWLCYTPKVNHYYSLLSTYLSACPPILLLPHSSCVSQSLPSNPDSTSFMTTYSKLPSSSHADPATINNKMDAFCLCAFASFGFFCMPKIFLLNVCKETFRQVLWNSSLLFLLYIFYLSCSCLITLRNKNIHAN